MNDRSELTATINKLRKGMQWLEDQTADSTIRFTTDQQEIITRFTLAFCLLQHTQLICASILALFTHNHPSGAFALARSLFESYVRSIWILECATDDEVNAFLDETKEDRKKFPSLRNAIESIKNRQSDHAPLIEKVEQRLDILNDWVHVGVQICARQFDGINIRPNYPIWQQFEVVDTFVKPLLFESGVETLDIFGLDQQTTFETFANVIGQELDLHPTVSEERTTLV